MQIKAKNLQKIFSDLKLPKIKIPTKIFGIRTYFIFSIIGFFLNFLHFTILLFAFLLMGAMLTMPMLNVTGLMQNGISVASDANSVVFSIPLKFQNFLPLENELNLGILAETASGFEIKKIADFNSITKLNAFESKDLTLTKKFDINKFVEFQNAKNVKLSGSLKEKNILSELEISVEFIQNLNKEADKNAT